jgi:hypothetical protein
MHQLQHHSIPSTDHGTNGYFIFDDLTTALQLQDRSNNNNTSLSNSINNITNNNNNDHIASIVSSSISSTIGNITHHQQQHQQHPSHLTLSHSHSLPMLTSSSSPTANMQGQHHQQTQKCNFGELNLKTNKPHTKTYIKLKISKQNACILKAPIYYLLFILL